MIRAGGSTHRATYSSIPVTSKRLLAKTRNRDLPAATASAAPWSGPVISGELRRRVNVSTHKDMCARAIPGAAWGLSFTNITKLTLRPSTYHSIESGSAMLSSERISASMPNLISVRAAISIRIAANT
jgi:hypothetical protein